MAAVAQFDENGRMVYDPDQKLEIGWADAIAAHNAAQALLMVLKDKAVELPDHVEWSVRNWLPTAVKPGPRNDVADTLPDRDAAIAWLTELRGRLREVLPWPLRRDEQAGGMTAEEVLARHFPGLTPEEADAALRG